MGSSLAGGQRAKGHSPEVSLPVDATEHDEAIDAFLLQIWRGALRPPGGCLGSAAAAASFACLLRGALELGGPGGVPLLPLALGLQPRFRRHDSFFLLYLGGGSDCVTMLS